MYWDLCEVQSIVYMGYCEMCVILGYCVGYIVYSLECVACGALCIVYSV